MCGRTKSRCKLPCKTVLDFPALGCSSHYLKGRKEHFVQMAHLDASFGLSYVDQYFVISDDPTGEFVAGLTLPTLAPGVRLFAVDEHYDLRELVPGDGLVVEVFQYGRYYVKSLFQDQTCAHMAIGILCLAVLRDDAEPSPCLWNPRSPHKIVFEDPAIDKKHLRIREDPTIDNKPFMHLLC